MAYEEDKIIEQLRQRQRQNLGGTGRGSYVGDPMTIKRRSPDEAIPTRRVYLESMNREGPFKQRTVQERPSATFSTTLNQFGDTIREGLQYVKDSPDRARLNRVNRRLAAREAASKIPKAVDPNLGISGLTASATDYIQRQQGGGPGQGAASPISNQMGAEGANNAPKRSDSPGAVFTPTNAPAYDFPETTSPRVNTPTSTTPTRQTTFGRPTGPVVTSEDSLKRTLNGMRAEQSVRMERLAAQMQRERAFGGGEVDRSGPVVGSNSAWRRQQEAKNAARREDQLRNEFMRRTRGMSPGRQAQLFNAFEEARANRIGEAYNYDKLAAEEGIAARSDTTTRRGQDIDRERNVLGYQSDLADVQVEREKNALEQQKFGIQEGRKEREFQFEQQKFGEDLGLRRQQFGLDIARHNEDILKNLNDYNMKKAQLAQKEGIDRGTLVKGTMDNFRKLQDLLDKPEYNYSDIQKQQMYDAYWSSAMSSGLASEDIAARYLSEKGLAALQEAKKREAEEEEAAKEAERERYLNIYNYPVRG